MNDFISFEKSQNQINYFFNKNHFVVLLLSVVIIVFFSMYLSRQRTKHQKIATFFVSILLLTIETLRIIWNYKFLEFNNEELEFFNITNMDFFTLCLWISIPLMLIGSFTKKKGNHNVFGLNFVFSVATLFAIITLIYPLNINTNFEFYHCYNLIYLLERSLIIMLGLMFVFSKWITVENLLDLWKAIFSMLSLFIICYVIVSLSNTPDNIFYMSYFPVFDSLGIHLAFPMHLVLLFAFLFVFQILLYLPFFIHKSYKLKHGSY